MRITARQFYRVIYIQYVFAKHGVDALLVDIPWLTTFHYIKYFNPWNWFKKRNARGEALRSAIEELGPIFIKFGQALSTRPDILPLDIALALAQLQDNVAAFPSDFAIAKIEQELGAPISVLFDEFDPIPLASASIAQVHTAKLLENGREVVVKVLRPKIRKRIQEDLAIMKRLAIILERYWPDSRRYKPIALVEEFETYLIDELDLRREGANAIQLRRQFLGSSLLYVPEVFWPYTRPEVLVLERIYGIPISDKVGMLEAGINIKKLAQKGVEIFFTQVFEHSFFHADMHPGNIFVSTVLPDDPSYICVDFGLMGSLSDSDQRYLAYNLYAFFNRDYRRVAQLHIESGWVARSTRVEELESAIRVICEPIFEQPFDKISFAQLVIHLFQAAKRFQMEVQPQLVLLQKTLLAIEGLGKQLYPELDLWQTGKPYLERWLKSKIGLKVFWKELTNQLPFIVEQLPHLPHLLYDVLELNKSQSLWIHEQRLLIEHASRYKKGRFNLNGILIVLFIVLGLLIGKYYL